MDLRRARRTGVSPVIAELLLIAICVSAGVTAYVYVTGFSSNLSKPQGLLVTDQVTLVAYNFANPSTLTVYVQNTGGTGVEVSGIYFDGLPAVPAVQAVGTSCTPTYPSFCTPGQTLSLAIALSPSTVGTSHTIKAVSTVGSQFAFTVVAGTDM